MLQQIISPYLQALDAQMRNVLEERLADEPGFGVMLRYAMGWVDENDQPYSTPTGKRLRPALLLLVNQSSGGDWHKALPAAAAVELLHNFSLIHDDIQDNSETRHGRPTVWRIWGMANAINAGDALFSLSYGALESLSSFVPAQKLVDIWAVFNRTNVELTRGQHLDMRFEQQSEVSAEAYISMISGKSAALLAACSQIGSLIATDDSQQAEHFYTFGLNIGIAFQIHDDILGIWGDPSVTGKSAATDIIARKKSLPVLYGLEHSERLNELYDGSEMTDQRVSECVDILDQLAARDYAQQLESRYYDIALAALNKVALAQDARQQMQVFVDFLFQRDY